MARGCKVERDVDTGSASEGWLGYDLHPFVDVDGGGGALPRRVGGFGGVMGLYYRKDDEEA